MSIADRLHLLRISAILCVKRNLHTRSVAFAYFTLNDQSATVDLSKLRAKLVRAWWYDPRAGVGILIGELEGGIPHECKTPPYGPDWVLVLDDTATNLPLPGLISLAH